MRTALEQPAGSCPAYRLVFRLPRELVESVPPGRHQPSADGCVLCVERGLCTIDGPTAEQVIEQAGRLFRVHARGRTAVAVLAQLVVPALPPSRKALRISLAANGFVVETAADPELVLWPTAGTPRAGAAGAAGAPADTATGDGAG